MSVGLMGATGTLDIDGLTVELVPIGGADTTNLVVNGDFELGDPAPASWVVERDVRQGLPGISVVVRGRRADPGQAHGSRPDWRSRSSRSRHST